MTHHEINLQCIRSRHLKFLSKGRIEPAASWLLSGFVESAACDQIVKIYQSQYEAGVITHTSNPKDGNHLNHYIEENSISLCARPLPT